MAPMFPNTHCELSVGQFCYSELVEAGEWSYPPFEPYDDPTGRSHELVERLRNEIMTWDEVHGFFPHWGATWIANLLLLADLAGEAARHARAVLDEEEVAEARYEGLLTALRDQARSEGLTVREVA